MALVLRVECPYTFFRKPYARSIWESFRFAPPSTVYGMLLSLVGEYDAKKYLPIEMAFAYKSVPQVSQAFTARSRWSGPDNKWDPKEHRHYPKRIEYVVNLDFLVSVQTPSGDFEDSILKATNSPFEVFGDYILSLGISDGIVNNVTEYNGNDLWIPLRADPEGFEELPIWTVIDGSTHWARFRIDQPEKLPDCLNAPVRIAL